MKKKIIIISSILVVIAIIITAILFINHKEEQFYLDDEYYQSNQITEINVDELNELTNEKKSFAVFIYQPMCFASADFESILNTFIQNNQISIYKIAFSDIKNTDLGKTIKYYPSFIIYNKGKIVDFLEADKDKDVDYYTSEEGFKSWFTKYVKLKEPSANSDYSLSDSNNANENNNQNVNNIVDEIVLENISKDKNKVNIYFFWGNGCPHCEEEFKFFNDIKAKYGKYYNLYTFETWYDKENSKLLYTFAENMGDTLTGVPYTIIGSKSFNGFGEQFKDEFISAIKQERKNSFDIYFDKIKKNNS